MRREGESWRLLGVAVVNRGFRSFHTQVESGACLIIFKRQSEGIASNNARKDLLAGL